MGLQLFDVFDGNRNGLIDFSEFLIGLSKLVKGTDEEKMDSKCYFVMI